MYIHIKSESQRPNHQPMNTNEVFFYQWNQWHLSSTSPPSARQKLRKQKSCTEFCGERGAECVTWYRSSKISTVQKKTQRGLLTLPKHFMYGILCLPTFTMKKPTIDSNIYIYIYIPSPLGHQYTQEHPHCVGGETLICLGDSNPDFIFIWNQKLWRYYWWKNKWNYFSVLEHYDDILCMKQFQLKKTCSNRYHFGSTSLIFFSKPLTTRPRWPSLMTNTMTADPRTQWCGVCRSMFFWCGLMNRKQQKTGGFFQVWRWNEVYEQGIDFCWEIFVCKFNTCSWRLQVRRFGTGWTMHFDEDVVSTMGTNTLRYPRPSPINSVKMVFLHIIHINGRGGISQQILYRFQSFRLKRGIH